MTMIEPTIVPMGKRGRVIRRQLGEPFTPPRVRWMAIQTVPRQEGLANWHLRDVGFWTFYPVMLKTIKHARQTSEQLRPYLPGYVFAQCMPHQNWAVAAGARGVQSVVANDDGPVWVRDHDMVALMALADPDGLVKAPSKPASTRMLLDVGDRVRLDEGPFTGFLAVVDDIDSDSQITVTIDILGRPTPMTMPAGWVSRAKTQFTRDARRVANRGAK